MVVTRRSRSNNSLAGNNHDDDTGSFVSARGGSRASRGGAPPPPPPPPPPQQQQLGVLGEPTDQQQQQQQQQQPAEGGAMAAIPEEVELLHDNVGNANENNMPRNNMETYNNNQLVEQGNNNNNINVVPPPVAAVVAAPIQYLQVRVPPPSQSTYRPSRIHRRHHPRAPMNNTQQHMHNKRSKIKSRGSQHSNDGEIVRVLIPPAGFASERQLAECLSQAGAVDFDRVQDDSRYYMDQMDDEFSLDEYFDDRRDGVQVAGMFRESDRVFVPLSIIYSSPASFVGEVLCLKRPPPPPKRSIRHPTPGAATPRRSIFLTFLEILGILLVAAWAWWIYGAAQDVDWEYVMEEFVIKVEKFFFAIVNFPFWLFDILIEFPLREIYRHGPSIIGWEGEPLPRICARITYHGDEAFWARNIDECERIYYAKELAAMQVRKPIVIGFLILVLFYMVKSIVEARALRRRERIDPNMVETYRAIHMLMRQLRRAANTR